MIDSTPEQGGDRAYELVAWYAAHGFALAWTNGKEGEDARKATRGSWQEKATIPTPDGDGRFGSAAGSFAGRQAKANPIIATRASSGILLEIDSPEWLDRIQALGLPETLTIQSSPGKCHRHYLPPDGLGIGEETKLAFLFERGAAAAQAKVDQYVLGPGAVNVKYDPPCDYIVQLEAPRARLTMGQYEALLQLADEDTPASGLLQQARLSGDADDAGKARFQLDHAEACRYWRRQTEITPETITAGVEHVLAYGAKTHKKGARERSAVRRDVKAAAKWIEREGNLGADVGRAPDVEQVGERAQAWDELLEALEAVDSVDGVLDVLRDHKPPRSKMARTQLRGVLVKSLGDIYDRLNVTISASKMADSWLSEMQEHDDGDLQGQSFAPDPVEPWAASVELATILDEVFAVFESYVYTETASLVGMTLWATFTHVFDSFDVVPYLIVESPTMRCGKSTTMLVAGSLVRVGLLASNVSPAALFRSVDAWKPTLLIDEADSFLSFSDELRGILNSGNTRATAYTIRAEGDANEPRRFSTFCPKAVAGIGRMPSTIEDRGVRVYLMRKPVSAVRGNAFDSHELAESSARAQAMLARVALDYGDEIKRATREIERPGGLDDRAWSQKWQPLLAIAHVAGEDWYRRAADAAVKLSNGDDDQADESLLALHHVYGAVCNTMDGRLSTETILHELVSRDDGPWASKWARDLQTGDYKTPEYKRASSQLAKLLQPFGVRPKVLRFGEATLRGYERSMFESEKVAPYLTFPGTPPEDETDETDVTLAPALERDVTSVTPVTSSQEGTEQNACLLCGGEVEGTALRCPDCVEKAS